MCTVPFLTLNLNTEHTQITHDIRATEKSAFTLLKLKTKYSERIQPFILLESDVSSLTCL